MGSRSGVAETHNRLLPARRSSKSSTSRYLANASRFWNTERPGRLIRLRVGRLARHHARRIGPDDSECGKPSVGAYKRVTAMIETVISRRPSMTGCAALEEVPRGYASEPRLGGGSPRPRARRSSYRPRSVDRLLDGERALTGLAEFRNLFVSPSLRVPAVSTACRS